MFGFFSVMFLMVEWYKDYVSVIICKEKMEKKEFSWRQNGIAFLITWCNLAFSAMCNIVQGCLLRYSCEYKFKSGREEGEKD